MCRRPSFLKIISEDWYHRPRTPVTRRGHIEAKGARAMRLTESICLRAKKITSTPARGHLARIVFAVLVLSLAGCRGPARVVPSGNTAMLGAPTPQPDTTAGTKTGDVMPALATDAEGVCDVIRSVLEEIPGAEVTIRQGGLEERSQVPCKSSCHFVVNGTFAGLQGTPRPEERIAKALQDYGFLYDHRFDADGPDGTRFKLRTDARACTIEGRWDGGDDSDTTYVPGDWYEFFVDCTCDHWGGDR